ncbi:MAG: hypothetical protein JKY27_13620 [Magnetovibrio sp.]|nr:hypothetical protein [Magnetovibrio sp.]MBL4758719.1 hypothetical protein [Hyphomicrobiales bacterium]
MFELFFVWAISALALGFGVVMVSLFVHSVLSGLGRLVFIDPEAATDSVNLNGHSAA